MRHYKLVLPGDLNHYGYLFGGNTLKWVDEFSWITATSDYPGCNFVTVAMDQVEFRKSVKEGSILIFDIKRIKEGNSSVQYEVNVIKEIIETGETEAIFFTRVTFVCLDDHGKKCSLEQHLRKHPI